jgi:hypothetical protein
VWRRFALENAGGVGRFGKAAAWPPHSKMGWAAYELTCSAMLIDVGGARFALYIGDGAVTR